jgi:hypothetical protein
MTLASTHSAKIILFLSFWYILSPVSADSSFATPTTEQIRCGWFDNPTPNNASLMDQDGEWIISRAGGENRGHEAAGQWPKFSKNNYTFTGQGSYGYGCTCMKVISTLEGNEIVEIKWAKEKPLAACRKDPASKAKEPFNPLN